MKKVKVEHDSDHSIKHNEEKFEQEYRKISVSDPIYIELEKSDETSNNLQHCTVVKGVSMDKYQCNLNHSLTYVFIFQLLGCK